MAYQFLNTIFPINGADALFQWKQFMVSTVGWTVIASSDGVDGYSNSSDIITSSNTGSGGLNNPLAWFVIEMPNGRQFCFQRSNYSPGDASWLIIYTISGFINHGTLIKTPTAGNVNNVNPDQVYLLGSIVNSTTTFGTLFNDSSKYILNCVADNASPYGVFLFTYKRGAITLNPTIQIASVFLIDPLITGSYPNNDQDPYVFYIDGTNYYSNILMPNLINSAASILAQTYIRRGLTFQTFIQQPQSGGGVIAAAYGVGGQGSYVLAPANPINDQVSNAFNEKDDFFPIYYFALPGAQSIYSTYKGTSSMLSYASLLRYNGDLLQVVNPGDCLYLNGVVVPWNNTSLPIV